MIFGLLLIDVFLILSINSLNVLCVFIFFELSYSASNSSVIINPWSFAKDFILLTCVSILPLFMNCSLVETLVYDQTVDP
ncbi:hypothetical protein LG45_04930 [Flavobacterium aquatile LMG 4008 = ATCC 11947]|uniref:Uncharacterized protein n=1 Tax=Flavobacterium aquatile LMG 4008 = ATCC 11947 TaxID=1453498 RepID=A0A095SXA4_9FLAO|nr:hypothetical protein LG45_04930 [Flavobacterium aquatile LMG 4008 = ATCC 11947]